MLTTFSAFFAKIGEMLTVTMLKTIIVRSSERWNCSEIPSRIRIIATIAIAIQSLCSVLRKRKLKKNAMTAPTMHDAVIVNEADAIF